MGSGNGGARVLARLSPSVSLTHGRHVLDLAFAVRLGVGRGGGRQRARVSRARAAFARFGVGTHPPLLPYPLAHQRGAPVVVQGAGDDLGRGRRAGIDQDGERRVGRERTTASRVERDGLGRRVAARHAEDGGAAIQPDGRDVHPGRDEAAGVAAEVEHKRARAAARERRDRGAHVAGGARGEGGEADVAHAVVAWRREGGGAGRVEGGHAPPPKRGGGGVGRVEGGRAPPPFSLFPSPPYLARAPTSM